MVDTVTTRRMKTRRGGITEVIVTDGSGRLVLTFFNQPWRERDLRPGRIGLFAGTVGVYRRHRQLAHPDYVLLPEGLTSQRRPRSSPTSSFPSTPPPPISPHGKLRVASGWSSTPSAPYLTRFRRRSDSGWG